jgi:hypothetical protein
MRKSLFLFLIVAILAFSGIAVAADKIGTFGAPNASGTYPMEVTDDKAITVASDASFTNAGTTSLTGTTSTAALTATTLAATTKSTFKNMVISGMSTVSVASPETSLDAASIASNKIFVPVVSGSYTTDNGTNIAAASPGIAVGSAIPFVISNPTAGTITLVGTTGSVVSGSATVATMQNKTFYAVYMASNSFTIY